MRSTSLLPTLTSAALVASQVAAQSGYTSPSSGGGSSLTVVNNTFPAGLGEPLNVIVSGASSSQVLQDSLEQGGFLNWALSLQFGAECTTVSTNDAGVGHQANLGQGLQEEIATLRENFGDVNFGTCLETLNGGSHFRYYIQSSTKAFFLEASIEKPLSEQHDIVPNGYDLGRDGIVGRACGNITMPTTTLTNGSTFSGSSTYNGWTYDNSVVYVSGMLSNSSDGVNHASTVATNGRPAIDGLTAVITVSVSQQGSSGTATASGVPAGTSVSDFSVAYPTLRIGHILSLALVVSVTVLLGAGGRFVG